MKEIEIDLFRMIGDEFKSHWTNFTQPTPGQYIVNISSDFSLALAIQVLPRKSGLHVRPSILFFWLAAEEIIQTCLGKAPPPWPVATLSFSFEDAIDLFDIDAIPTPSVHLISTKESISELAHELVTKFVDIARVLTEKICNPEGLLALYRADERAFSAYSMRSDYVVGAMLLLLGLDAELREFLDQRQRTLSSLTQDRSLEPFLDFSDRLRSKALPH